MAISDKLNYLIETKNLFKDRLNSLGAEIIESTTFRNYLTWLDTFYGEVSDKTDLSQNGVVGRTSQNTAILPSEYTQVDYIESSGTQYIDTGYSFNNNLNVDISFQGLNNENAYYGVFGARESNNTSRFAISYQASSKKIAFNYGSVDTGAINNTDVETNKVVVYNEGLKFYLNNENIRTFSNGCGEGTRNCLLFTFRNNDNSLYRQSSIKLYYLKMYDNDILIRDFIPCYRNSDNEIGLYDIVNNVFYTNQGTGVFTYGSVVSIPNPDYPQPINNLSGDVAYKVSGKNLFDKSNVNVLNAYFTANSPTITSSSSDRTIYIPCEPNTTYTISKNLVAYGRAVGYTSTIPAISSSVEGTINISANSSSGTITTGANANYLVMRAFNTGQDTLTYQQVLASIQIEKNSTATTYEAYIEPQTFNIPLKSKNLFDKNNFTYSNGWYDDNGVLNTSSKTSHSNNYIEINKSTTYTISGFRVATPSGAEKYSTLQRVYYWDDSKTFIARSVTFNGATYGTFTTPNNAKYITFQVSSDSTFVYDINDDLDTIQLEENTTPTDYEPYYDIELCKIGDYEDKIYSSDGRFYLEKKTGKVVLNGSENWSAFASVNYEYQLSLFAGLSTDTSNQYFPALCNKYINHNVTGSSLSNYEFSHFSTQPSTVKERFVRFRNNDITTLANWKTELQTNNAILYVPLSTPTTTEITQENYPSLYNALKQIQDYLTAYKINKEFILGYDSPEIEY